MTQCWRMAFVFLAVGLLGCKQGPYLPQKVTPQEVESRLQHGEPIVIADVRSERSYEREHIDGAVHFAFASLLGKEKTKVPLPKDRWVLLYCTWPNEHSSAGAARKLHDDYGYSRLLVLKGGMRAWKDAGYKTIKAALKDAAPAAKAQAARR